MPPLTVVAHAARPAIRTRVAAIRRSIASPSTRVRARRGSAAGGCPHPETQPPSPAAPPASACRRKVRRLPLTGPPPSPSRPMNRGLHARPQSKPQAKADSRLGTLSLVWPSGYHHRTSHASPKATSCYGCRGNSRRWMRAKVGSSRYETSPPARLVDRAPSAFDVVRWRPPSQPASAEICDPRGHSSDPKGHRDQPGDRGLPRSLSRCRSRSRLEVELGALVHAIRSQGHREAGVSGRERPSSRRWPPVFSSAR